MTPQRLITVLAVLLTASLCANAFQAGYVFSRPHHPSMEGRPGGGEDGQPGDRLRAGMQRFMEKLPPEARAPLQQSLKGQRAAMAEGLQAMQQSRRDVAALLQSDVLDAEALREALAAQRQAQGVVQQSVHEALIEGLADVPPEVRRELGRDAGKLFR